MPRMKLRVPSMGSTMNRRADGPRAPSSSPRMPCSGKAATSTSAMASSAPRSASVTGEPSGFSVAPVPRRKCASATSPPPRAASAITSTTLSTLGMPGGFLVPTTLRGQAKFPATDFTHLARLSLETFVLAVPAASPYRSLAEYLDAARKAPGSVSVGTAGAGALTHLPAAALGQKSGAKLNIIHFAGGAKEIAAVLGGHAASGVFSQVEVLPHAGAAGGLRVLATFGEARSDKLPEVPTLKEQGIVGVPPGPWQGIAAPKDLPAPHRITLVTAITRAAQEPSWKAFLQQSGLASHFLSGAALDTFLKDEIETLGALLKAGDISQGPPPAGGRSPREPISSPARRCF